MGNDIIRQIGFSEFNNRKKKQGNHIQKPVRQHHKNIENHFDFV